MAAAAVMFDTQKYVKKLQAGQFSAEQAEAQSEAMREVLETAFASHAKEQQEVSTRTANDLDSKTEKALIKLEAKVDRLEERMASRFTLLQWMLTVLITGVAGLLVRAFFMT